MERSVSFIDYLDEFFNLLYIPYDYLVSNIPFFEVVLYVIVAGIIISIIFSVFRR